MKYVLMILSIILVNMVMAAPNISESSANWVLVSNINNEPEYWDVTDVKYSVAPNNGGVFIYTNIKLEYTYYGRSFETNGSTNIGVATQLYNSFIYDVCKTRKWGKDAASGGLAASVTNIKGLCAIKKNGKFTVLMYQGALLIQNNRIYLVSPPIADISMYMYVNNNPVLQLTTKADLAEAKTTDLYNSSINRKDTTAKYNMMVNTMNTYILPQINKNSQLKLGNLTQIAE